MTTHVVPIATETSPTQNQVASVATAVTSLAVETSATPAITPTITASTPSSVDHHSAMDIAPAKNPFIKPQKTSQIKNHSSPTSMDLSSPTNQNTDPTTTQNPFSVSATLLNSHNPSSFVDSTSQPTIKLPNQPEIPKPPDLKDHDPSTTTKPTFPNLGSLLEKGVHPL